MGCRILFLKTIGRHIPFLTLNARLKERFVGENLNFTSDTKESDIFFTTCEHLVAPRDGSVLVTSEQINEPANELPSNLIVFATTSQLVEDISDGLKIIKQRYAKNIPGNITTLKHFNCLKTMKKTLCLTVVHQRIFIYY